MEFLTHNTHMGKLAELQGDGVLIAELDDAVDIIGNADYQGFKKIIVHQHQVNPAFFDLKTGLAGDILQKFSNYRMKLAIVGDFQNYSSKSLHDFIYESNKHGQTCFVSTIEEAIHLLK